MTTTEVTIPLTFAHLQEAALLPPAFVLPESVRNLPPAEQDRLLGNLLIPVARLDPLYDPQRQLMYSMQKATSNPHLRNYCMHFILLTMRALDFVRTHGKPDYTLVPDAVVAGEIGREDGRAIADIYAFWIALQLFKR